MDDDEQSVLTWYVWHNLQHLMSDEDRRIGKAAVIRLQVECVTDEAYARKLLKGPGRLGDPEIDRALVDGPKAFRDDVARRLLADSANLAFILRCPRCSRVVRTPKAAQCFWCGHDWHDALRV